MQNTVQQFQAAEETRVVAPKEVEESPWQEAVSTQKEAEKVAEKEKQIVQNKERRVETAAADCRVQGSLFLFFFFDKDGDRHFDHQGVGHSHAILDQNPTEAQFVGHDQRSGC